MTYYIRVTASFALSGILHHIVDMTLNIPSSEAGMMTFFMMQPIGMAIEDLVIWSWRRMSGGRELGSRTSKVIGYV